MAIVLFALFLLISSWTRRAWLLCQAVSFLRTDSRTVFHACKVTRVKRSWSFCTAGLVSPTWLWATLPSPLGRCADCFAFLTHSKIGSPKSTIRLSYFLNHIKYSRTLLKTACPDFSDVRLKCGHNDTVICEHADDLAMRSRQECPRIHDIDYHINANHDWSQCGSVCVNLCAGPLSNVILVSLVVITSSVNVLDKTTNADQLYSSWYSDSSVDWDLLDSKHRGACHLSD